MSLNVLTGIHIPITSALHPETLHYEEPEVGRDMFLKDAADVVRLFLSDDRLILNLH